MYKVDVILLYIYMGIDSIQPFLNYFKLYYNKMTLLTFLKPVTETIRLNQKKNIKYEISEGRRLNSKNQLKTLEAIRKCSEKERIYLFKYFFEKLYAY
ncbi:MAG: hypothetical protein QG610_2130 [Euryarchaeota archaeon]|nr:hypothetical protein [Euryarchaeota archaeon]